MFRMPSNRTLTKIAVYGAFLSISGAMYFKYKIENGIRNSEYFRQALNTLRSCPGAVKVLGEPIRDINFDLSDKNNYSDGKNVQFEVEVKGPLDKGKIFFWANRHDGKWYIERLELEVNSEPNKRFLVIETESHKDSDKIIE